MFSNYSYEPSQSVAWDNTAEYRIGDKSGRPIDFTLRNFDPKSRLGNPDSPENEEARDSDNEVRHDDLREVLGGSEMDDVGDTSVSQRLTEAKSPESTLSNRNPDTRYLAKDLSTRTPNTGNFYSNPFNNFSTNIPKTNPYGQNPNVSAGQTNRDQSQTERGTSQNFDLLFALEPLAEHAQPRYRILSQEERFNTLMDESH